MKRYDEAIEVAWKAYDECKHTKSLALSTYLMMLMGAIYIDLEEKNLARMYLSLAQEVTGSKESGADEQYGAKVCG